MVIMYVEKLEGFNERIFVHMVKVYTANTLTEWLKKFFVAVERA